MAKKSAVEKNNRRRKMVERYAGKREALKAIVHGPQPRSRGALRRDA